MKTWKLLLALPIIFCLCFAGSIQQYQAQIIKMKKAAAGESWEIDEDFTDCSDWTVWCGGTWTCDGEYSADSGQDHRGTYYSGTNLTNVYRQYAKVKILDHDYIGLILRMVIDGTPADSDGYWISAAATTMYWQFFTACTTNSVIKSDTIVAMEDGDWLCAEIENTGDDTICRIWLPGSSDPGHRSTWGAANFTWTDNPSTPQDTGTTVGLKGYSIVDKDVDDFAAASNVGAP